MPAFNPMSEELDLRCERGPNMAHVTPLGRPQIRYKGRYGDFVLEADVFPGKDLGTFEVHIYCPRCSTPELPHNNRITSERKAIEFENGLLSIEAFECCWELQQREGERIAFGAGLCRMKMGITKNVAKDA